MFMDSKILHEYVLTFHKYRTLIVPCKYALICNPLDCKFCEAMVVSDCVKNPLKFKFLYYARSSKIWHGHGGQPSNETAENQNVAIPGSCTCFGLEGL